MSIACGNGAATIDMTPTGLKLLHEALTAWLSGGEDFGVSPTHSRLKRRELGRNDLLSGEIWFWGPHSEP